MVFVVDRRREIHARCNPADDDDEGGDDHTSTEIVL